MNTKKERQKEFMARSLVGMVMYNKREFTDEECEVYNSILRLFESNVPSEPKPAPPPAPPLPKEVEEAMGRMAVAIHEAGLYRHLLVKRAIASTYTIARVEKDFDDDQSALAVIKFALKPKKVTSEWFRKLFEAMIYQEGTNEPAGIIQPVAKTMLYEKGIEVEP